MNTFPQYNQFGKTMHQTHSQWCSETSVLAKVRAIVWELFGNKCATCLEPTFLETVAQHNSATQFLQRNYSGEAFRSVEEGSLQQRGDFESEAQTIVRGKVCAEGRA